MNEWENLIYKVFYFHPDNPIHLQGWLEIMYITEGLEFVGASGEYFIFKPIKRKDGEE